MVLAFFFKCDKNASRCAVVISIIEAGMVRILSEEEVGVVTAGIGGSCSSEEVVVGGAVSSDERPPVRLERRKIGKACACTCMRGLLLKGFACPGELFPGPGVTAERLAACDKKGCEEPCLELLGVIFFPNGGSGDMPFSKNTGLADVSEPFALGLEVKNLELGKMIAGGEEGLLLP